MTDPRPMSEADLQTAVIELAGRLGWLTHHARPALRQSGKWSTPIAGDPGFPDLVLARDMQVIFAELKSAKGSLSKAQIEWRGHLETAADQARYVRYLVWRPDDWTGGSILGALR